MKTRVRAEIVGRVQGVGFRPTVYRYATQLGLGGFVRNGPEGVTLEVEGDPSNVGAFFSHLAKEPPRQSVIARIDTEVLDEKGYDHFEVVESIPDGDAEVHMPPDLATCDDCVRELLNPDDRRYGYPFINCTNCGPRYTIIRDLPYDRAKTSMAEFTMCGPCSLEYHDPSDRRFHAQPDACPQCGPRLQLRIPHSGSPFSSPLAEAQDMLRRGLIVAIKSLGGYHLACDATNKKAIALLRARKHRPDKPFAVMFRDTDAVRRFCRLGEAEEAELLSVARPIVLLHRRHSKHEVAFWRELSGLADAPPSVTRELVDSISPDTDTVGAFLPYTPLHHLLMQGFDALVMTSGNLTDEPIISDESELPTLLGPIADAALTHDRPIVHKCDDSVLRVIHGQRQFLRRARGYVPNPIRIADHSPHILAVGGELKNTFCLVRDGYAFLSQHIGDLKDFKTYEYLEREIESCQKLMRVRPEAVAYDLHPDYLSTKFAQKHPIKNKTAVQHHHAHIVSVMAEHDVHDPVIGVALDGTGYGTDGTIWGGEFLIADRVNFERAAHFKPYPLPGGDKAIAEPWRMAVSVLVSEGLICPARGCAPKHKFETVQHMVESGFNSPLTSSAGRLFDAVASILGLCDVASYEAQAAIRLETIADPRMVDSYRFNIESGSRPLQLDFGPTMHAIVDARRRGHGLKGIAARFHNTVAQAVTQTCVRLRAASDHNVVALSGGVFQNVLLLRRTRELLGSRGFRVLTNSLVPPNDGGLALGQAAVAAARLKGK